MMYREVAPHPKLRKHIKCFWMLDHDYGNSRHDHEQLWADAHTELIFTSGQRYRSRSPFSGERRGVAPNGVSDRPLTK